jgi:hypothetical protein
LNSQETWVHLLDEQCSHTRRELGLAKIKGNYLSANINSGWTWCLPFCWKCACPNILDVHKLRHLHPDSKSKQILLNFELQEKVR